MKNYNLKVWRNSPDKFSPTVNENLSGTKLIEWLMILMPNIQAKSSKPLVTRIEITKIGRKNVKNSF